MLGRLGIEVNVLFRLREPNTVDILLNS